MILVSSLRKLQGDGVTFVFSDRHAYLQAAQFSSDLADLNRIDWSILQRRDFGRDPDDMGKLERYQAEALVHRHMPVGSLLGIVCYNDGVRERLDGLAKGRNMGLKFVVKPNWYV